jgi:hypothetical protein
VREDITGESSGPRELVLSDLARYAGFQAALDGVACDVVRRRIPTVRQEYLSVPEPFLRKATKIPSVHGTSARWQLPKLVTRRAQYRSGTTQRQ